MPLRLAVKKLLVQRSDRVKGVDLHPTEPWILANLYNGSVIIWNFRDRTMVKNFEVTDLPVRAAKFIARKQWIVTGSDDNIMRVFNYNTMDKVKVFEAHTDYIRSVAVHPSQPYVLTSSDDMLIKLWDWERGWQCIQVFEGHAHFVMQVVFNPKDTNTFASASLDHTVKVWSIGQPMPNFTLEGHDKGINCVDYFTGGDKPYIITGADDRLVKIWDYQTKSCVNTLEGHAHNISSVCFHPELPLIVTGSEDGTIRLWHSTTYRLEQTLNYGLERVWSMAYVKGSNMLGIGYDEGTVLLQLGREEPLTSMDPGGKIIVAKHNEIQTMNLKSLAADAELTDGERISLSVKDMGNSDLYPQSLQHSPNGRFVAVCGDGEYIIYTALAWRNKSFGQGLEFVWSYDSSMYAIRESGSVMKVFKNFKEDNVFRLDYHAEGCFGGALLAVRSKDFVCFHDWVDGSIVRRIDVAAKNVLWSSGGEMVAIVSDDTVYILAFHRELVDEFLEAGEEAGEDGIEDAFELLHEVPARVQSAIWVGECFIYNDASWHLNYFVGGESTTLFHLDHPMYIIGYLSALNRLILIDKEFSVVSYKLLLSIVEYKTLVIRGDMEGAQGMLASIPEDQHNSIAQFLEAKGFQQEALQVATDDRYRFDLAVQLGYLDVAKDIALSLNTPSLWKQLGELAMSSGNVAVAEESYKKGRDLGGLLLIYSSSGDQAGMESLISMAKEDGKFNVAFLALFVLGRCSDCVTLLCESGRIPEAAFFARTYVPSRMEEVTQLWKDDLGKINKTAADSLADPATNADLFPDLEWALKAESMRDQLTSTAVPSTAFPQYEGVTMGNLIEQVKEMGINGTTPAPAVVENGFAKTEADQAPSAEAPLDEAPETVSPEEQVAPEPEPEPEPAPVEVPVPEPEADAAPFEEEGAEEAGFEDDLAEAGLDEEVGEDGDIDVELDDDWGLEDDGDLE